jgi:hypothetical protein
MKWYSIKQIDEMGVLNIKRYAINYHAKKGNIKVERFGIGTTSPYMISEKTLEELKKKYPKLNS